MPRIRTAALFCLLLLGTGLLAPAHAGDFGEPPPQCPAEIFAAISEEVAVQCARRNQLSCLDVEGCFNLRRTLQLFEGCYRAIQKLDNVCYFGTYLYLKVELLSIGHQMDICAERIAMPEPLGCGRPCRP